MDRVSNGTQGAGNSFVKGTILDHQFQQNLQEEIMGVVEGAGLVADGANQGQLMEAIQAIATATSQTSSGTGELGAVVDPSSPSGKGVFDYQSLIIGTDVTYKSGSIIRVKGDLTLTATLRVSKGTPINSLFTDISGIDGVSGAAEQSGGGGTYSRGGNGGNNNLGAGGAATTYNGVYFDRMIPMVGGGNSKPDPVGGYLIIIVGGNFTSTGGSVTSDVPHGIGGQWGGCGGGNIIIHCNGTATDLDVACIGGNAGDFGGPSAIDGGGGAGGTVMIRSRVLAGSVSANTNGGGASTEDQPDDGFVIIQSVSDGASRSIVNALVIKDMSITAKEFSALGSPFG